MSVPAENRDILSTFIQESREKLDKIMPLIKELVAAPEDKQHSYEAIGHCFQLFHSIRGSAAHLELEHLSEVAASAEKLLKHAQERLPVLNQETLSLMQEVCDFAINALPLIETTCSDDLLADSALQLSSALSSASGVEQIAEAVPESAQGAVEMEELYVKEVLELLAAVEQEFLLWEYIVVDQERLAELFQALHRLRKDFAYFSLPDLERLSLAMEGAIDRFLAGEVFRGEYPEEIFLRIIDAMKSTVASLSNHSDGRIPGVEEHLDELYAIMRHPLGELLVQAGFVGLETIEQALKVQEDQRETEKEPKRIGELLVDMGEITSDQIAETLQKQQKKEEMFGQPVSIERRKTLHACRSFSRKNEPNTDTYIRVHGGRLEKMLELIKDLGLYRDAEQGTEKGSFAGIVAELQDMAFAIHQVEMRELVNRMERRIQDMIDTSGKRIHFQIEGEEKEIDRHLLSVLEDLLLHLIRNAVDHGIEAEEERKTRGKDAIGEITLSCIRQMDEIWMRVEDDGRGIDFDAILQAGIRLQLIDPGQQDVTQQDIVRLIFRPGVSSMNTISGYSGRGIGLDAVRRQLTTLHGRAEVVSRQGKGTRITLRIPSDRLQYLVPAVDV